MKKFLIAVLVVTLTSIVYAEKFNLNISGGYATVGMDNMNKSLQSQKEQFDQTIEFLKDFGGTGSTSITKFGSGIFLAVDAGYEVLSGISIGPKIVYLSCSQAKLTAEVQSFFGIINIEQTVDASLIPLMVGGRYSTKITEKISLLGGVYLGYGLANYKSVEKSEKIISNYGFSITNLKSSVKMDNSLQPSQNVEVPADGLGFVGEISADVKYAITPNVSLGVNLGYRLAKIDELKATKDAPEFNIKKGDVIKDENGKTIPADYSGLTIGVGLTFKF
jgi:opacity protein-like surface antigen